MWHLALIFLHISTEIKMQNTSKQLTVGLITGARRVNANAVTIREYYNPSPLFRYRLKYCENNCDTILTISPEKFLAELEGFPSENNLGLENIVWKNFAKWKAEAAQEIAKRIPVGSTLIFLAGNRFRQLIPMLADKYICKEPTKGMGLGQQLKYFKNLYGRIDI